MLHVNDTIRFLNAVGGGRIVRLDEAKQVAYVETDDGFEIPTLFSECVVVASDASAKDYSLQTRQLLSRGPSQGQIVAKSKAEKAKPTVSANGKKEPKQDDVMEVDLHVSALLPAGVVAEQAELLSFQLRTFRRIMRDELRHKGKRIVFIHGNGEGVLRKELQTILRREFPSCLSLEARMQKYGTGATMVIIN